MLDNDNLPLNSKEAATQLGVTEGTLRQWRYLNKGPTYYRIGSGPKAQIHYLPKDLEAWKAANVTKVTPENSRPLL